MSELKRVDVEVTFCTPNPERLALTLGVACPCKYYLAPVSHHTAACGRRPNPNRARAFLFGWKNAREAMRMDLKPYPLHYRIDGREYRRRRRTR